MCCGGCGGANAPQTGGATVMGVPGTNTTVPMQAPVVVPKEMLTTPASPRTEPEWWVVLLIGVAVGYVVNS